MSQLIKFEGKPIEKLIEEVSKGIGTLYRPRAIRKNAEAEAQRIEIIAKADAKKALIEYETETELIKRTKQRLFNQELNRQINMENIAEKSIKHLPNEVSSDPIDADWRTRFFNKAQDISEEETQEIWAKILAGEIAKPGKISIRTLETISNLNKKEAQLFEKVCSFVTNNNYILKPIDALGEYNITFGNLLTLKDAGLIHNSDNLVIISKRIRIPDFPVFFVQKIGNNYYQLEPKESYKEETLSLPQISLTVAGGELCRILKIDINQRYIQQIINEIKIKGFRVKKVPQKNNS